MAYGTFSYWRSWVQSESPMVAVTLSPVAEEPPLPAGLHIAVAGARIEVEPGFDAELLRRVVAALSSC